MIRVIDNKRVDLTNDEYSAYKGICRSYDRQDFKGEDLFSDHFEVNDEGIIIFVRPPSGRYTSLEVYTFLVSIMVNQHLRISQDVVASFIEEAKKDIQKFKESVLKDIYEDEDEDEDEV